MKLFSLISAILLFFCVSSCNRILGVRCIKYGKSNTEHEIYIHSVGGFGVDGYFNDEYYLVITNYKNNTMTTKDLVDIAQKFIDTAYSKRPIGDIIILGQLPGGCIPYEDYNERVHEKYGIIEIGFEGSNPKNNGNIKDLRYVIYYNHGKPSDNIIYLNDSRIKDSILNSKKLITN